MFILFHATTFVNSKILDPRDSPGGPLIVLIALDINFRLIYNIPRKEYLHD